MKSIFSVFNRWSLRTKINSLFYGLGAFLMLLSATVIYSFLEIERMNAALSDAVNEDALTMRELQYNASQVWQYVSDLSLNYDEKVVNGELRVHQNKSG
jgi:hypothetical protein